MIQNVRFKIRDEERWLTTVHFSYRLDFDENADLDKIIQLHQKVSEELGSDKSLPVFGGLFHIVFSSTDHDQFFYDWLLEGVMQDGQIEFIQNEVETVSRIDFWDCYCISLEERMSAGGAPMEIKLVLSPAIMKKDGILHEKIW